MKIMKTVHRLVEWIEQYFPAWSRRRHRRKWDRKWANPNYTPFWKTQEPQKELVEAIDSGWFPKAQRIIDLGCGSGEISRWLADQGLPVLGVDCSPAAVQNCRLYSADQFKAPKFEVVDLCEDGLRLETASSLIDRGCFHRLPENLRPIFAQNVARATVPGGHFLLLSSTFQDPRFSQYPGARSAGELREHVTAIFGDYFTVERTEPGMINSGGDQKPLPALAFWMVRNSQPVPSRAEVVALSLLGSLILTPSLGACSSACCPATLLETVANCVLTLCSVAG
jgi:SAM-dependent methyltransferase